MTDKGKNAIKPLVEILGGINTKMIADLNEEEQKTIITYLNRMIKNLEEIK